MILVASYCWSLFVESISVFLITPMALGVGRNCCVISKQHVPDEILAYLRLGAETGEVEEPVI